MWGGAFSPANVMFDKLASEENRYDELTRLLSTAEVQADPNEMRKHAKALSELEPLVEKYREYKSVASEIAQAEEMVAGSDADMRELAKGELKSLTARRDALIGDLKIPRVPATEASGRIHTSTATVAVLPEAEEVDIQINEKDLRIDTFCSSGPGGQSVNTTYSAVRITHIPTNTVVSQQDEKSQIKNRSKAMKVLRSRLYEMEMRKQQEAIAKDRRSQVGTGERSEKIRTYHFKDNRITDHRANFTTHRLVEVLNGDLAELLDSINTFYQSEKLKDASVV